MNTNPVNLAVRFALEWVLFGFAVWALFDLGFARPGEIMGAVLILHYAVSYDRTWAMLRNKRYDGFSKDKFPV